MAASLLVFLNNDVGMERPYSVTVPASVDTLAELCQYLTARVPRRPGSDDDDNDTTGRGYRFLYSVAGKPLWRVKECVDAGAIVLSVGPGFLARRPTSLAAAAAAAAAPPPVAVADRTTPDRSPTHHSVRSGSVPTGSASASPPVKRPDDDARAYRGAAYPAVAGGAASRRTASTATARPGGGGGHGTAEAAPPPDATSPNDERERLVSITMNTAMRGRGSSGGDRPWSNHTPAASPAAEEAPAAALPSTLPAALPRGMVFLAHETHPLPPRPAFPTAASLTASAALLPPPLQPLSSTSIASSLQYYLLRKWAAYERLHSTAPAELIAGEALSRLFTALAPQRSAADATSAAAPCRVLVSGPPRSGVSTTAAFLLRHYVRTLQFQPQYPLHNTLLLAIDFDLLLLGTTASTATATLPQQQQQQQSSSSSSQLLLDISALYQLIVRAVLDAVVAQRPALREAGPLLAQLWDRVILPNVQPPAPPNFASFSQAAALVGLDVLQSWTRLAALAYPILQAACRAPHVPELRDAALDLLFYAIPAELASSMHFSGIVYVLDGAEHLARCHRHRVTRPAGDLGPLLRAITADPRTHLILAWPSALPSQTLHLPSLTAHVSTIGLVTRAALNATCFPQVLRCYAREYPLEVFLGCPGYLAALRGIATPYRKTLSIPTTAFSLTYQQSYDGGGGGRTATAATRDGYALRLDTPAAAQALEKLLQLVQTLPLC
ncbi:hypothetical protein NESM_000505700 [Novymonas esmeraldas]|uniref:Uncharacterized protein n=1 Tax=Novymonas esmeraldas TaxID=1808958 RepID=A0AAW0EQ21_9TRYP